MNSFSPQNSLVALALRGERGLKHLIFFLTVTNMGLLSPFGARED